MLQSSKDCCPPPLCGNDLCGTFCAFINILPSGPMWDYWKARSTSYFQMSGNVDTCDPVVDPECPTLIQHAIYCVLKLKDIVHNGLYPALRESDPTTAVATLDDWLERMKWQDCYASGCRSIALGELTPYEIMTECGPVFCPVEFPDDIVCAVKRGILISLTRVNMGVIKNLDGLNWVVEPLGAQVVPTQPYGEPPCEFGSGPSGCDGMCPCSEDLKFEVRPTSLELPGCEDRTVCNTRGTGSTVSGFYGSSCWPAGMPNCIWPGLLAAECIIRSLVPGINITTNSDFPVDPQGEIPIPVNFDVVAQQNFNSIGETTYTGLATWTVDNYRYATEVEYSWPGSTQAVMTGTGNIKATIPELKEGIANKVRARHWLNGVLGPWTDYITLIPEDDLPWAFESFAIIEPSLGNVTIQLKAKNDLDLANADVYLVPHGQTLNKNTHPKKRYVMTANQLLTSVAFGDPLTVNLITNGNFSVVPPQPYLQAGWSIVNGKLVHEAQYARCATSTDGINWTDRATPNPPSSNTEGFNYYSHVWCQSKGIWVAVANTGTRTRQIITSPDGINWTPRILPEDIAPNAIAYSAPLGIFVVVGFSGTNRGAYSVDGFTWLPIVSTALAALSWRDITWAPELGLFIAVSQTNSASAMATSPDGLVWTRRGSAGQGGWQAVVWAGAPKNLAVAVGNSGSTYRVMTSPDGITWTGQPGIPITESPRVVEYSPILGQFLAVANAGPNRVWTSTDGISWTVQASAWPNAQWAAAAWGNNMWVVMAAAPNILITSLDGVNWTERFGISRQAWRSVEYANGMFVALSQNDSSEGIATAWQGIVPSLAPGDILRTGMTIENILGWVTARTYNAATIASNENAGQTASNATGKQLLRSTARVNSANTIGIFQNVTQTVRLDDFAAFKETPASLTQGFYDLYAYPIGDTGLEGPPTVLSNVAVV